MPASIEKCGYVSACQGRIAAVYAAVGEVVEPQAGLKLLLLKRTCRASQIELGTDESEVILERGTAAAQQV
jgi:hypothetical protein